MTFGTAGGAGADTGGASATPGASTPAATGATGTPGATEASGTGSDGSMASTGADLALSLGLSAAGLVASGTGSWFLARGRRGGTSREI